MAALLLCFKLALKIEFMGELMLSESNIKLLWDYVDKGEEFPWPRSQKSKEKLSQSISVLINDDRVASELNALDKREFNVKIRKIIAPKLREGQANQSARIARWIVSDWGGIRAGNGSVAGWTERLGKFDHASIESFVNEMGVNRVSSWSKILAFADPINHAIYDARTAVALNCALHHLEIDWRFSMPVSRNNSMIEARPMLQPKERVNELGYTAYIDLLKSISKACELGDDILNVEMTLFANAPSIARNFVNGASQRIT